jgi:hypothetical protein
VPQRGIHEGEAHQESADNFRSDQGVLCRKQDGKMNYQHHQFKDGGERPEGQHHLRDNHDHRGPLHRDSHEDQFRGLPSGEKDSNDKRNSGNTAPQGWSNNGLIGVKFNVSGGMGSGSYDIKQNAQHPINQVIAAG